MTRVIRPKFHWRTVVLTILVCGILAGIAAAVYMTRGQNPLPGSIRDQVHFPVFYPSPPATADDASFKYDQPSGVLSFHVLLPDGQLATFTEQATPDPFNDIPNYYTQFLAKIYEYQAFDSFLGTVHLTHPKGAGQAAVMNAKGTLMFVRVAQDEPKTTWQQLFDKLVIYTS